MEFSILVADDDPVLRQLICDILKKQGYHPFEAENGKQALDIFFSSTEISLCILDVMMPIYDGWEVLEEIRAHSDVPVIMLTALGDERNEVKGLSHGADDYIAKPFSYAVFIARIESLLKKAKKKKEEVFILGDIIINNQVRQVLVLGEDIKLNNKEYKLLQYFAENQRIVLDREKILERIWGYDFEGDIRTIDTHVKMLRAKLGKCGDYIKTVRGAGYRFEVVR